MLQSGQTKGRRRDLVDQERHEPQESHEALSSGLRSLERHEALASSLQRVWSVVERHETQGSGSGASGVSRGANERPSVGLERRCAERSWSVNLERPERQEALSSGLQRVRSVTERLEGSLDGQTSSNKMPVHLLKLDRSIRSSL
jgi:hypothetical protein